MTALLATLVLIFGFQADNITGKSLHVVLIAVPILIQVYFNCGADLRPDAAVSSVQYSVAAPGALIGASISLSWPWRPRLRCLARNRARRWQRSWAFWWKCRSCSRFARRATERGTGSLKLTPRRPCDALERRSTMLCYECSQTGTRQAKPSVFAITALSPSVNNTRSMIDDPVTMTALINRTVVLPKKARVLLCSTCLSCAATGKSCIVRWAVAQ